MEKPVRCSKHKYIYVNGRGFGNEFAIYTIPMSWTVKTWYDPNSRPVEQSRIAREEAIKRWNHYTLKCEVANVVFYACPVCGYAPITEPTDPLKSWPPVSLEKYKADFTR